MSRVLQDVFGSRPNISNLQKFFSSELIQILWKQLYLNSEAFKKIIKMLGDENYKRAFQKRRSNGDDSESLSAESIQFHEYLMQDPQEKCID